MRKYDTIAEGLIYSSICTSYPIEEAIADFNEDNPTGIQSKWALSSDEHFKGGQPNPCPCETHPETHKHYLLVC